MCEILLAVKLPFMLVLPAPPSSFTCPTSSTKCLPVMPPDFNIAEQDGLVPTALPIPPRWQSGLEVGGVDGGWGSLPMCRWWEHECCYTDSPAQRSPLPSSALPVREQVFAACKNGQGPENHNVKHPS